MAGPAMYAKLTPQWAGTLLGLVQVALIPIPFVFYKWGEGIRKRSPMIRQLRDDQERSERRAAKAKKQRERREAMERGETAMADEAGEIGTDKETGATTTRLTKEEI